MKGLTRRITVIGIMAIGLPLTTNVTVRLWNERDAKR
jgi:hypothetical protein